MRKDCIAVIEWGWDGVEILPFTVVVEDCIPRTPEYIFPDETHKEDEHGEN